MKKSENNNLKDTFVCEFYSTLLKGVVELDQLSSTSSTEDSNSSSTSSDESN